MKNGMRKAMKQDFSYREYVEDEKFIHEYNDYQNRYADNLRESDKVIVALLKDLAKRVRWRDLTVLDIGCSTGNLLLHLKNNLPGALYVGGDLAKSSIELCRKNPALQGMRFREMDLLDLPARYADIVIVNAVLYMMDADQYRKALASIANCLKKNGKTIIYDFAHPFVHQNLTIHETSLSHPKGLRLCFRPMAYIEEEMRKAGFRKVSFQPFELPIDLPQSRYDEEVVTYTVPKRGGKRMMFRGVLYQPWCHITATKP